MEPSGLYGLSIQTLNALEKVFTAYSEVKAVLIFGSRAKGINRKGSDIDLALEGNISQQVKYRLEEDIEELLLPYRVDVVVLDNVKDAGFRAEILRYGKTLYERSGSA